MQVTVERELDTAQSTISIVAFDGVFFCFGLEPPARKRIPAGTYQVTKSQTFSPILIATLARLGMPPVTPRLYGVPGWPNDDIEWHPGNVPEETHGCLLVGLARTINRVEQSDAAFVKLMARLPDAFAVTYRDVQQVGPTDPELGT